MPRIKGIHTAMKSAMLAAEAVFPLLENFEEVESFDSGKEAGNYQNCLNKAGCIKSFMPRAMSVRHSNGAFTSARFIPASTR
ncbi:putative electron transfer flavoprotein-ubiquinone oxidoreductase [Neisseria gonorrhoeae]|nr:putative electron transfer flavoprotein-ubiquinone oxidoreductase [Neisseria gonorrhoeae]